MPYSGPEFRNALKTILASFEHPDVLDIGVGAGKTSELVPPGTHLVGIEAHAPYAKQFEAVWNAKYARVHIGDAMKVSLDLSGSRFDVVVMGDVLEHMWLHDALSLLMFWSMRSGFVIAVWPEGFEQDAVGGAQSEIHRSRIRLMDIVSTGLDVVRYHKHYREFPSSKQIVVIRGKGDKQAGVAY